MKTNSIKTKLLALVMFSTVISFMILGFYNANNNYSSEYNLIKQKELNLAKSTSKFINSYIQSKIDIVEAVSKEVSPLTLNTKNSQIVEKLRLGKEAGKFEGLYIGFKENGNFLQFDASSRTPQTHDYDARKRGWFKKAIKLDGPAVSEPYIDFTSKKLVISISTPLKKDGVIVGVVGSDIFITTIVDSVLNIKLDGMGTAYLLDEKEKIIIHKNQKLLNTNDSLFSQIKTTNKSDFGEALEKGVEKLLAYSTIKTSNWKIMIKLDRDEIFEKINAQILKEITLYIVLLFIILGFILFSLIKILSPLKTVEEGFNYFFKYLKGEESSIKNIDIKTNDEFGNMAKVINKEMQVIASHLEE
ncbi:MAG: chemotaxis protein, partial [Arcobacter sp.]